MNELRLDGQVSGLQEETAEKYYEKMSKSFDTSDRMECSLPEKISFEDEEND